MDDKLRYQELIDNYIQGILSDQGKKEIEIKLKNNPDFKKQYEETLMLKKAITVVERSDFLNKLMEIEADITSGKNSEFEEVTRVRSMDIRKYIYIAASIFVAVTIYAAIQVVNEFREAKLYANYYQPYGDLKVQVSRGMDIKHQTLVDAKELYEAGDYQGCVTIIEKLDPEEMDDALIQLIYGLALMGMENYQDAIAHFDNSLQIEPQNEITIWYKALALIKRGRKVEAREQLSLIRGNKDFPVMDLLEDL